MSDQNYAELYEDMVESSQRMREASGRAEQVIFGSAFAPDVIVPGYSPQPTWNKRFAVLEKSMRDAIIAGGYNPGNPIRTFDAGAILSNVNDTIRQTVGANQFYWRWDGSFPKTVEAGSEPTPTGVGAWLQVGDGQLAQELVAGTALIGGELSGDIASALLKSDIRIYPGSFTQKIQAALDFCGTAFVPYGQWDHDLGTVGLSDNQHIIFGGSFINRVGTGDSDFIQAVGKKNFSVTGAAVYVGSRGGNPSFAAETFIKVDGGRGYTISGALVATACRGHGFLFRSGATAGGVRGERGQITGCAAYACDTNLEIAAAQSAEYLTFSNFNACGGRIGIKDGGGNSIFNGGNCCDNTEINFWLVGDYNNHAHGIVDGMNVNHGAVYNLRCDNVYNGHTFSNNHFFGNTLGSSSGAIFLNNCKGIVIEGGVIDCWIYNFDGPQSGRNYVRNVDMPGGYGPVELLDQSSLRPKDLIVTNARGEGAYKSGVSISDPSDFYFAGFRNAGATQAVTSGVATVVRYPTVQSNGDRRQAYDPVTGLLTIPLDMSGQCRVLIEQYFQCASGADPSATFIEVRINGANKRLGLASVNGGIILACNMCFDVYLAGGDVIDVIAVVTGVNPVIGVAGYVSSFSVMRLS